MTRFTRLVACVAAASIALAVPAFAQEVLDKTKDEHGFERQLTTTDMMHQTASQLIAAGQFDKAAEELEKVVQQEPARVEAWLDLGKCYSELKNYEKASGAYLSAHQLEPARMDLLSNLGHAQVMSAEHWSKANPDDKTTTRWDAAIETYTKMLAADPANYDANVHLGFLYQKEGNIEKAVIHYEKVLETNPQDMQTIGSLAGIYAEQKRNPDAIALFEKAIAGSEGDTRNKFRAQLGKILIAEQQFDKAELVYADLVAEKPDNASYQYNLGASLKAQKKSKEAIPCLEKAIEIKPDFALAYQELAGAYNDVGRHNEAIGMARKGVEHADKKAGLYVAWGEALEKQQSYDEAISMFSKATTDAQWGAYAKAKIKRQQDLKKRALAAAGEGE